MTEPLSRERASILLKTIFVEELDCAEPDERPANYPEMQWSDPQPDHEHGERLRKDRIARGLTIAERAERLGRLPDELTR